MEFLFMVAAAIVMLLCGPVIIVAFFRDMIEDVRLRSALSLPVFPTIIACTVMILVGISVASWGLGMLICAIDGGAL